MRSLGLGNLVISGIYQVLSVVNKQYKTKHNDLILLNTCKISLYSVSTALWLSNKIWFSYQHLYCIRHIFRGGFIFANSTTRGECYFTRISRVGCYSRIQQHAKINLPPIPTQECDLCIRNTSSTVHSARANE